MLLASSINFVEAKGSQQGDGSLTLTVLGDKKATFRPAKALNLADWFANRDREADQKAAELKEKAAQKGYVEKGNKDEVFRYHIAKVNEEYARSNFPYCGKGGSPQFSTPIRAILSFPRRRTS